MTMLGISLSPSDHHHHPVRYGSALLVILALFSNSLNGVLSTRPDSCTNRTDKVLPRAFDGSSLPYGYSHETGQSRWRLAAGIRSPSGNEILPLHNSDGTERKFIVFDVTNKTHKIGARSEFNALLIQVPPGTGMCVTFQYASFADGPDAIPKLSINHYFTWDHHEKTGIRSEPIGAITDVTNGEWQEYSLETCINGSFSIKFETVKVSSNALIAVEKLVFTYSDKICPGLLDRVTTSTSAPSTTTVRDRTGSSDRDSTSTSAPSTTTVRGSSDRDSTSTSAPSTTTVRGHTTTTKTTTQTTTQRRTTPQKTTTQKPSQESTKTTTTKTTTKPTTTTKRTTKPTPPGTTPLPRHDFFCDAERVHIHIPVSLLPNSKLTLVGDESCVLQSNGTHYVLRYKYNECGSTVIEHDHQLIVSNTIKVTKLIKPSPVIQFDSDFKIPIECTMDKNTFLEGAMEAITRDPIIEVAGRAHWKTKYRLREFKTENYIEDITAYPVKVPINREVFLQLSSYYDRPQFGINIAECFATPTSDPEDPLTYPLMRDGCPVSPAVHLVPSSSETKRRFKVQAFHFKGEANINNRVYFHCRVSYCMLHNCPKTDCPGSPGSPGNSEHSNFRRSIRKRSLRRSSEEIISVGPYHVV